MTVISYRRHRFPPSIIQHAIWLYLRFTLSYRDVEDRACAREGEAGIDEPSRDSRRLYGAKIRRLEDRVRRKIGRAHV